MKHDRLRVFPLRLIMVFIVVLPLCSPFEITTSTESLTFASQADTSDTLNAVQNSASHSGTPSSTFIPAPTFSPGSYYMGNPSSTSPPSGTDLPMYYIDILDQKIGQRLSGSMKERKAADFIYQEFLEMGYKPEVQQFYFFYDMEQVRDSQNVFAFKKGSSDSTIVVGAHMDSNGSGKGADDNGSGVSVMLSAARMLSGEHTQYSIIFVSFGAEEKRLKGSEYFVDHLTNEQREKLVGMINLDTLASGDKLYVYGESSDSEFLNQALEIIKRLDLPIVTQKGENPQYPKGTTGDRSDHVAFKEIDIPFVYMEATNWDIGDKTGRVQTKDYGRIIHNEKDDLDFIERKFPGRARTNMDSFLRLLLELLSASAISYHS